MIKKQIKQLAKASFTRGNIDSKKALRVARMLKRGELREYIKYLKTQISANKVRVLVPDLGKIDETKIKKHFSKFFPDKKIFVEQNPELLLGIKVIDNDIIYDFNLKDSFENMNGYLKE